MNWVVILICLPGFASVVLLVGSIVRLIQTGKYWYFIPVVIALFSVVSSFLQAILYFHWNVSPLVPLGSFMIGLIAFLAVSITTYQAPAPPSNVG